MFYLNLAQVYWLYAATSLSGVGCGVDVVFPGKNRLLYQDVAAVAALLSEYPPGSPPLGWHFPLRNRILSGLCAGAVIVEGGIRSGALITLRSALAQGRETFAVPGPVDAPMSLGPNLLIQRGEAKLILSGWDILIEFEGRYPGRLERRPPLEEAEVELPPRPETREVSPPQESREERKPVDKGESRAYITIKECRTRFTDDEGAVLLELGEQCLSADELVERTQIPARRILSALTMLQVGDWVEELPGKRFESKLLIKTE